MFCSVRALRAGGPRLIQGTDAQVADPLAFRRLAPSSVPRCPNRLLNLRHRLYDNSKIDSIATLFRLISDVGLGYTQIRHRSLAAARPNCIVPLAFDPGAMRDREQLLWPAPARASCPTWFRSGRGCSKRTIALSLLREFNESVDAVDFVFIECPLIAAVKQRKREAQPGCKAVLLRTNELPGLVQ